MRREKPAARNRPRRSGGVDSERPTAAHARPRRPNARVPHSRCLAPAILERTRCLRGVRVERLGSPALDVCDDFVESPDAVEHDHDSFVSTGPHSTATLGMERAWQVIMHKMILSVLVAAAPLVWSGCAGSIPPPTQRMADAQAAERSAAELGANRVPAAQLSLKLAQEQIAQAKKAMADDENKRADSLLIRAKADAELALAQTREQTAKVAVAEAVDDSAEQKATNIGQGAVK